MRVWPVTGLHKRFSGGRNKTQLIKSNIQKDVYIDWEMNKKRRNTNEYSKFRK